MKLVMSLLGIVVILGLLWLLSWDRKNVNWTLVIKALLVQTVLAIIIVKIPLGQKLVTIASDGVTAVVNCGKDGLEFVFGDLADGSRFSVFVVQSLGGIIFVSALINLLYYVGAVGFVVKWLGRGVGKLMGTTEVESFVAVANMFLGQTSSPVLVSKYIGNMTDSEIFVILVSGMGSMEVSILAGYNACGIPMEYLLIASVMVPIGSILVSKIVLPEKEVAKSIKDVSMDNKGNNNNVIDAIAEGAATGMQMVISIAASLVAIIGLVAFVNMILGMGNLSLTKIFSYVFAPFGFLLGLDVQDALLEGALLGQKMMMNEFVAFGDLGTKIANLDPRTGMIASISLAGFANLGSLGICVSGIAVLCPEKKSTLSRLVFKAMLGGMLVSVLSATIVGIVALF